MFRKTTVLLVFLALVAHSTVSAQSVAIDAALSNAAQEIAKSVPKGTKIAVLNMSSDYGNLSDYIIDELIVNLVNTRSFQVVPRSTVALELVKRELDFQMTGNVSDDSQKRLGQFLGAGAIISGSITRESANSYRLVVNAIDVESFTYQTSYRISVQNNNKMKELVKAAGGGVFNEDYTPGERIGMGALNIFFGAGSLMNGHKIGGLTTGLEVAGILSILSGLIFVSIPEEPKTYIYVDGFTIFNPYYYSEKAEYDEAIATRNTFITIGSAAVGVGIVFGFIVPFFHHKPNARVSQINVPFNLELVSDNQGVNGLRMSYNMRF